MHRIVPACVVLLALAAFPSAAQLDARVVIALDGGQQAAGTGFSNKIEFHDPTFGFEAGEIGTRYRSGGGTLFGGGVRVRVAGNLAVGVGMSLHSRDGGAGVDARIPHPFLFDQPRRSTLGVSGLGRREMATHVPIHWLVPVGRSVEIALFGGPTVFQVRQDLVSGIAFEQRYAYTAATATGAQTRERSGMATGYHAGAEVAFYFSDQAEPLPRVGPSGVDPPFIQCRLRGSPRSRSRDPRG